MKRFVMAVALACALSSSALAGIVHSTDAPAPAPQPSSSVFAGIIHSTDAPAPAPQPSSSVVAIILTIIGIVR